MGLYSPVRAIKSIRKPDTKRFCSKRFCSWLATHFGQLPMKLGRLEMRRFKHLHIMQTNPVQQFMVIPDADRYVIYEGRIDLSNREVLKDILIFFFPGIENKRVKASKVYEMGLPREEPDQIDYF
jgi:hypothetical protein